MFFSNLKDFPLFLYFFSVNSKWYISSKYRLWTLCNGKGLGITFLCWACFFFSLGFNYTSHIASLLQYVPDWFDLLLRLKIQLKFVGKTVMISRRRNEHLGNLALMPYLLSKGIQHHYYFIPSTRSSMFMKYVVLFIYYSLGNHSHLWHILNLQHGNGEVCRRKREGTVVSGTLFLISRLCSFSISLKRHCSISC